MSRFTRTMLYTLSLAMAVGGVMLLVDPALAQQNGVDLNAFAEQAGFASGADIRLIIARLIRTGIGFLGIILIGFVLYGGFVWMTAGGNAERVAKAKKILINSAIGVVIVLSSFAITQFVLSSLNASIGPGAGGPGGPGAGGGGYTSDRTNRGEFVLRSANTECAASVRNLQLQLVFSKNVQPSTVTQGQGVLVMTQGGDPVDGTYNVSGRKVTFTPSAECEGAPGEKCFAANSSYYVEFDPTTLKSTSGAPLKCGLDSPCSYDFETGEGIDLEAPAVAISSPTDGQPIVLNEVTELQALAQDDTGASTVEFLVDNNPIFAAGIDQSIPGPADTDRYFFTDETEWDTVGHIPNRSYQIRAIAADCSGHEASSDPIDVIVRPLSCTTGEPAEVCGGDPNSADYCGACDETQCTDNSECLSGVCSNGQCETIPRINSISPDNGQAGTYITIQGTGFGNIPGSVAFYGDGTEAQYTTSGAVSCNNVTQWTDTQIITIINGSVEDGPIGVLVPGKGEDRTDDAFGPYVPDFDANDIDRPGLCMIDPSSASPGGTVAVLGSNFRFEQGSSTLYLGDTPLENYDNWDFSSFTATVPRVAERTYTAQIFTGDNFCERNSEMACETDADCSEFGGSCLLLRSGSNPIKFTVASELTEDQPPIIRAVDSGWKACAGDASGALCVDDSSCGDVEGACQSAPQSGPPGQYITITGENFGTTAGGVKFYDPNTGRFAWGSTDFPEACTEGMWTNSQITVKVPEIDTNGNRLAGGAYNLFVERRTAEGAITSEDYPFEILAEQEAGPSICAINPTAGPPTTKVEVYGDRLSADSSVIFWQEQAGGLGFWNEETAFKLRTTVPASAETGPLVVQNFNGTRSNGINFEVGDCRENADICTEGTTCCANGSCSDSCDDTTPRAHYVYKFSTTDIPVVPDIVRQCGQESRAASPSPSSQYTNDGSVCINALVHAEFTTEINQASLQEPGNVVVEQCIVDDEGVCDRFEPIEAMVIETTVKDFFWKPSTNYFFPNTTYRVTLGTGIESVEGENLAEPISWQFTTGAEDNVCTIGSVAVSPRIHTIEEVGVVDYTATPEDIDDRCLLVNANSDWEWSVDQVNSVQIAPKEDPKNALATAVQETVNGPAKIRATSSTDGNPWGEAELAVDFADPAVTGTYPNCDAACINAIIGARFNVKMDTASVRDAIRLYQCENALCQSDQDTAVYPGINAEVVFPESEEGREVRLSLNGNKLEPNAYYRMTIKGTAKSLSGVPLSKTGANYGTDYSWVFRTQASGVVCGVERVQVRPHEPRLKQIEQRQVFEALTYGQPDSCSKSGQLVTPPDITWETWTSSETGVAQLLDGGAIALSSQVPAWCSNRCLPLGTPVKIGDAICGDGTVQFGEDCDDGALSGTSESSCSSSCLTKPSLTLCDENTTENCCGNNQLDPGEECDAGEATALCSAQCLNLGSRSGLGGLQLCGNGIVDHEDQVGGEECDDGNTRNGDGCSSSCLNEGSIFKYDPQMAICGNGLAETTKGEECDDGNAESGDGCSSSCLKEGTNTCSSADATNCCGNNQIDANEQCDSTEGCSDRCLYEGSSVYYSEPSFCGDGDRGIGEVEACESSADRRTGPYAVAEVVESAPQFINEETNLATTIITATADGVSGDTTLGVECSCKSDLSCGDGTGCGAGGCCAPRPVVIAFNLAENQENVCRNADISVDFDRVIDENSLVRDTDLNGDGEISENEKAQPQIYLDVNKIGDQDIELEEQCPSEYTFRLVQEDDSAHNFLVRTWRWFARKLAKVFGQAVYAESFCMIPVTIEEQTVYGGEASTIHFRLSQPLLENAEYDIIIQGDDPATTQAEGVLSTLGVGMRSSSLEATGDTFERRSFTTGAEICELNTVRVEDTGELVTPVGEKPNFGIFTKDGEQHKLIAKAFSRRGNGLVQEVTSIPGTYEWSWGWTSSIAMDSTDPENVINIENSSTDSSTATAAGQNGEESVFATATIIDASAPTTVTNEEGEEVPVPAEQVQGSTRLRALLCEEPWPSTNGAFPWTDPDTNFSFYYCRDAGVDGPEGDLPDLKAVTVPNPPTGDLVKEMLFRTEQTEQDAIGVRVYQNPDHLPADVWYQLKDFGGSPSEIELDGYRGVQDGNTVYVTAANQSGNKIYSNIYVISYNEDAGELAQEIFNQVLNNWSFNANRTGGGLLISDENVCRTELEQVCYDRIDPFNNARTRVCTGVAGSDLVTQPNGEVINCSWDGECRAPVFQNVCVGATEEDGVTTPKFDENGKLVACETNADCSDLDNALCGETTVSYDKGFCDAEKAKLTRDTQRLGDIVRINRSLASRPVPELGEGTFIRTMSVSRWPSWVSQLGNAAGQALPTDPINSFISCEGEGFDPESCYNAAANEFKCAEGSHVYGFKSYGGESYTLYTQLEYDAAPWVQPIDQSPSDRVTVIAENANPTSTAAGFTGDSNFCSGLTYGSSAVCGDGVIGISDDNEVEVCEIGQTETITCDVQLCQNANLPEYNGISCTSNDECGVTGAEGECVTIVDGGQKTISCINDQDQCRFQELEESTAECLPFSCGNGIKEGVEECDDGPLNGRYGSRCNTSCKIVTPGQDTFYCGDGYLAGGEQCDCGSIDNNGTLSGDQNSWAYQNCRVNGGLVSNGQYNANSSVSCSLSCTSPGPTCGDRIVNGPEQCDGNAPETWSGKLCRYEGTSVGDACETDADCDGGVCGSENVGEIGAACPISSICIGGSDPGKACTSNNDCPPNSGNEQGICSTETYQLTRTRACGSSNACTWSDWSKCRGGDQFCGNGVLEGSEQCDDGNNSNNDACTNACKPNVCGDGNLYQGVESCDAGNQNGTPCDPRYGDTCSYCTNSCQYQTVTGGFCGNGVIDGGEYCDGNALPLVCINSDPSTGVIETRGTCSPENNGAIGAAAGCDEGFRCRPVGVCNGGELNGRSCTREGSAGARILDDSVECGTGNTCVMPTCANNCSASCPTTYQTRNLLVKPKNSENKTDSVELFSYDPSLPEQLDSAFLTIPACRVGTKITVDIDKSNVTPPTVDIVFLTDLSDSMNNEIDGRSRLSIVKEATTSAISHLFDSYPNGGMNIGLVSFQGDQIKRDAGLSSSNPEELIRIVNEYEAKNSTPTLEGVTEAYATVKQGGGDVKIIIMLTDGQPNGGKTNVENVREMITSEENESIRFFDVGILTSTQDTLHGYVRHMSSNTCGELGPDTEGEMQWSAAEDCIPNNGIEYAFRSETSSEVMQNYQSVVDSILGAVVQTIGTDSNNQTTFSNDAVSAGRNRQIQLPDSFACTDSEQFFPLNVSFNGEGSVELSNFRFTHCPITP